MSDEVKNQANEVFENGAKKIKALFIVRVCLWVIAFCATAFWIWYSFKLSADGVFDPYEYAAALRPVMYSGIVIAVVAVLLGFALYRKSKNIEKLIKS